MVLDLAFQRRHVQAELPAPVVQAIPLQRAAHRRETRRQHRHGFFVRQAVQAGVARRDQFLPEEIVETQVQQGTVHVQQDGVVIPPVEGMMRDDIHWRL